MRRANLEGLVVADFSRARRKAFIHDIVAFLFGENNDLLSFDEVQRRLRARGQAYSGVRPVEVAKIVGSVDRYKDFDRAFLPTQSRTARRWMSVDRAHHEAIHLPPVSLFKVGDLYFVRDGHHRVSVAREQGVEFIDAEVIQVQTRVPFNHKLRPEGLVIVGEYSDFLEQTGLDRLRPEQRIEFSTPGQYLTLLQHIETHRYFLGQESQCEVSWEEAVMDWYDSFYLPIVRIIRERNVLAHFPRRTEADLYIWVMDHLHYLKEQYGPDFSPEAATDDFTRQFSRKRVKVLQRGVKRVVASVAHIVAHITHG
ncbi:MAG: hypothetical protein P8186_12470 [Anaerolineae bacterium]